MKRQKFNKRFVSTIRFIYRFGLIKSLFILMSFMAAGEEFSIKWKGRQVYLRKGTSDFHVFLQVLAFEQYKIRPLNAENTQVIVDLGANIGLSAVYFKQMYPNASLIAVEPDKDNYDLLLKNVEGLKDVYCMNNSVWHTNKTLGLYDTGGGAYSYRVNEESSDEKMITRAVTINDIIEKYQLSKIDLLKIDIEGSEKEMFSKNTSWLSRVGCIIIELHDWFRPGCASSFFRSIDKMEYYMSFKGENVTIVFDKVAVAPVVIQNTEDKKKSFANRI